MSDKRRAKLRTNAEPRSSPALRCRAEQLNPCGGWSGAGCDRALSPSDLCRAHGRVTASVSHHRSSHRGYPVRTAGCCSVRLFGWLRMGGCACRDREPTTPSPVVGQYLHAACACEASAACAGMSSSRPTRCCDGCDGIAARCCCRFLRCSSASLRLRADFSLLFLFGFSLCIPLLPLAAASLPSHLHPQQQRHSLSVAAADHPYRRCSQRNCFNGSGGQQTVGDRERTAAANGTRRLGFAAACTCSGLRGSAIVATRTRARSSHSCVCSPARVLVSQQVGGTGASFARGFAQRATLPRAAARGTATVATHGSERYHSLHCRAHLRWCECVSAAC